MELKQNMNLHNKYEIKVVDAVSGMVKQEAVGYNVITDDFMKIRLGVYGTSSNQRYIMDARLGYIEFGTGTGAPAATDTALFTPLGKKEVEVLETVYQYPTSHISLQIKLGVDEYNGQTITEVGLDADYKPNGTTVRRQTLASHAMLQDSEGNPIAIQKTNTNVVFITAIFYCTYVPSGFGANGVYPKATANALVKWILTGSIDTMKISDSYLPLNYSTDLDDNCLDTLNGPSFTSGSGSFAQMTYILPTITVDDTQFNDSVIRTLGINGIGAFIFPDVSVFPDYEINRMTVGNGDGVTTEFNVRCPRIKAGTACVFVDGNELSVNEFTFDYDSNCIDSRALYYTADKNMSDLHAVFGDAASKTPSTYSDPLYWGYNHSINNLPSNSTVTQANPIKIDLGTPMQCNRLRIDNRRIPTAQQGYIRIEYSDDDVNWTNLTYTITETYSTSNMYWYEFSFPLITARYWRCYIAGYSWTYSFLEEGTSATTWGTRERTTKFRSTFFLGKSVPGLILAVPLQQGETIEISFKIDKPFKTENNILRMTCSVNLQRG